MSNAVDVLADLMETQRVLIDRSIQEGASDAELMKMLRELRATAIALAPYEAPRLQAVVPPPTLELPAGPRIERIKALVGRLGFQMVPLPMIEGTAEEAPGSPHSAISPSPASDVAPPQETHQRPSDEPPPLAPPAPSPASPAPSPAELEQRQRVAARKAEADADWRIEWAQDRARELNAERSGDPSPWTPPSPAWPNGRRRIEPVLPVEYRRARR